MSSKEENQTISNFLKDFFRVFSVIKRYERGNQGPTKHTFHRMLGMSARASGIWEEGEPVDAYEYDIEWAIKEIENLNEKAGRFFGEIEGVFLASFDKIMQELKERAKKVEKSGPEDES